jgi:hypothetical protein
MSGTEVDWTFDNIPAEGEPAPLTTTGQAGAGLRAGRPPSEKAPSRTVPRWVLVAVPVVAVALGVGAYLFGRAGWARLEAQVRGEVAYEDERSAARDAATVAAMQAGDSDWRVRRGAEVGLGLAAPLPAPNLLPTGAPARVASFKPAGDDVFEATVVREYADASGQAYAFELAQRYRNLGPGLWERLPPDDASLANTTVFAGAYLTVTFPVADLPWLTEALPAFESVLARACADWQCPPGLKLNVVFSAQYNARTSVLRANRPAGAGYPIVFDLPPLTASFSDRLFRLPSPHAAGYPRDAAAAAALTRATSAQLLAALASELGANNRRNPDYFLDALIAREEQRLGLSGAPALALTPFEFISPVGLWRMSGQGELAGMSDSLALRAQALSLVDFALEGQPPSVDAALLQHAGSYNDPAAWLESGLGGDGRDVVQRWREAALAGWTAAARPGFEGLVMTCGPEALRVGADGLQRVSARPQGLLVVGAAVTDDGRKLAALISGRQTLKLVVYDLADGTQQPLPILRPAALLGWTPAGSLLFLDVHPANGSSSYWRRLRLRQYDPASGRYATLLDDSVVPIWSERGVWSPDRRILGLSIHASQDLEADPPRLALVAPDDPNTIGLIVLPQAGYAPSFAPDGKRLAAFSGSDPFLAGTDGTDWRLNVIDWQANQLTTVLTSDEIETGKYGQAGALEWSPDGRWLSFVAIGSGTGPAAFLVPVEGGPARRLAGGGDNHGAWPLGFSADGRFLALMVYPGTPATNIVEVVDLAAPPDTPPKRFFAQAAAWSRTGHDLLLGGAAGLYAADAESGEVAWLWDTVCAGEGG